MLGVDVSKRTLHCTLVDPATLKARWSGEVENTSAGIARLLRRVEASVEWVVEPTGRYGDLLVRLARQAGRVLRLAQPRRAKRFLASLQERAKTDRVDSYGLARYGLSQPLPLYPEKSTEIDHLEQLQVARRGLVDAATQLQQRADVLPHVAALLAPTLATLRTQIAELESQIEQLLLQIAGPEPVQRLREIPGVGPVTTTAVLSCLLSRPLRSADQFVAFTGLDPQVRESGKYVGKRRLSKQGPGELRRLLYLAARSNLCVKDSPYRQQYERELAKGLCKQAAICAVARKLARTCWSITTHAAKYSAERVHTAPEREPHAPRQQKTGGHEP